VNTRTKLIVALSIALSFLGLLGCGTTNHLQTITLTSGSSTGTFEIKGINNVLQLKAIGNYSSTQTRDLTNVVTYVITPSGTSLTGPLPTPPQGMNIDKSGLTVATNPAICTFTNVGTTTTPAYALTGFYQVVASFQGITSQPVAIGIASSTGDGPSGACGM
jgi:hypothetical protein